MVSATRTASGLNRNLQYPEFSIRALDATATTHDE
jgi:hypothetical protein